MCVSKRRAQNHKISLQPFAFQSFLMDSMRQRAEFYTTFMHTAEKIHIPCHCSAFTPYLPGCVLHCKRSTGEASTGEASTSQLLSKKHRARICRTKLLGPVHGDAGRTIATMQAE